MGMPEAHAWLAAERAVQDRIIRAREHAGRPWLLHETCPSVRQHYFLLRCAGQQWVGRRCVGSHSGLPGNAVSACNLLGDAFRLGFGDREIQLDVTLRSSRDAAAFLTAAAADPLAELVFPFPALDSQGREWVCPPHYWQMASRHAAMLAEDERHLRDVCADTLRHALPPGASVHDPACSTGDFLAAMARACPALRFSGSDLSAAMIDTARQRHARLGLDFVCADAATLRPSSVDGLLVRFLNAEVVSRTQALTLFRGMARSVRPGGIAVLFGHTGVLVPVQAEAERLGWHVARCTASSHDGRALFQWYVLRNTAPPRDG